MERGTQRRIMKLPPPARRLGWENCWRQTIPALHDFLDDAAGLHSRVHARCRNGDGRFMFQCSF